MASKYYPDYAGQVPLLLKLNSKTEIPPADEALALQRVEDAVRLGADAVGYTLYVGRPSRRRTSSSSARSPEDCDRYGMPLVIWAYPRGRDIEKKGGRDSFFAIDYAARVAMEMGADVVKLNMPKLNPEKDKDAPAPYNEMEVTQEEAIRHCVESAGRSLVVLSGGSKVDDEKLLGPDADDHGGGRLGRDLRPQRVAARVERRPADHRADQGDAAQVAHADPVAGKGAAREAGRRGEYDGSSTRQQR